MSLQKKVGRLLIAGFKGITMSEEIKHLIHTYHIGGIILFGRNIGTPEEILALTNSLQAEAKKAGYETPLLICIDQENGVVRRLGEGTTIIPGAMLLGATDDPSIARKAGFLTGKELKALGINWNLAPVVDVNNNPKNPVIGVRSFGEHPIKVTEMAKNSMLGMQEAGVMTTLKHFPGHGDTSVDSHLDLPVIDHDLDRLHAVELVPFKECIAAGADAIMSAHVYFPALEKQENVPATLSHSVITGLLREELGFNGVITTDCMEMDAIAKRIGTVEGCVQAVEAGVDFVMVSHLHDLQEQAVLRMAEAVESGRISEQRIDESIERIEKLARNYTSWEEINGNKKVAEFVGSEKHHDEMKEIYKQGITEVTGPGIPIKAEDRVLLVHPKNEYAMMVEDKRYATLTMAEQLKKVHGNVVSMQIDKEVPGDVNMTEIAGMYDHIVVLTLNADKNENQRQLVDDLVASGKPVDVVAVRSPYDASYFPKVNRIICTYEFTESAFEVVAEFLAGQTSILGRLPVTIG
ncbi:beta-N-acetylhexosaminidase [Sporosarcina sp. ACRSL]|uniref:beta-N-acetylhexosaminidase n=1 Tax=Sporosarcina sp. ACRSL TaxID=2918215 RepID=UPI001EF70779|nr:beta-N-acetylhexosaminidase [Sporosarcina sp. ACRSL]MCG7344209.1 beta-N-acetylhexosaminidase [Sporosarcina sp. ACRSL]